MRMNERGIGTGALVAIIVGIIVAVVVPVSIAAVLLLGGGAPGGLPEYPGTTGYDMPSEVQAQLPAGVQVKGYTTSASVSDVVTWYKGQMPGQGWTLDNTHSQESYGLLIYQKGNDGAMILAVDGSQVGTSGTIIVLAVGPYETIIS